MVSSTSSEQNKTWYHLSCNLMLLFSFSFPSRNWNVPKSCITKEENEWYSKSSGHVPVRLFPNPALTPYPLCHKSTQFLLQRYLIHTATPYSQPKKLSPSNANMPSPYSYPDSLACPPPTTSSTHLHHSTTPLYLPASSPPYP